MIGELWKDLTLRLVFNETTYLEIFLELFVVTRLRSPNPNKRSDIWCLDLLHTEEAGLEKRKPFV